MPRRRSGFRPAVPSWADDAISRAAAGGPDIPAAIGVALDVGRRLPAPGLGDTATRWAVLAGLAYENVTVARVAEAHTDALAILGEAGRDVAAGCSWGVFASRSPDLEFDGATLTGTKPWCSLGDVLDRALVTAGDGLYEVDLRHAGVRARPAEGWVSRGLPTVTSVALDLTAVPAEPVGAAGWYLRRPGFVWGGIGVAACWFGAAVGVATALAGDDDVAALHAGRVDLALHAARCVLADAADAVDTGTADERLALRVRSVVADTAETVLREVAHSRGPAPLAFDERHAARVADLQIYVRQHHAERDVVALGRLSEAAT